MSIVKIILLTLSIFSLVFLIVGLYKPWVVLWWRAVANRLGVIKTWGTAFIILLVLYLIA